MSMMDQEKQVETQGRQAARWDGASLRLQVAAQSDIGRKRTNNEDCVGYDLEHNLFVVCDGMGGMAGGEVASRLAVECSLREYCERNGEDLAPEERLHAAIREANEAVWQAAQNDSKLRGMGTTLVAACVMQDCIVVGNVGDSRAYFLRDGACVQITEDHSYATEQKKLGAVFPIAASLRQMITRAVGVDAQVKPDFYRADLREGDVVLLATDGLTRYADEQAIAQIVSQGETLEAACNGLIAIAHASGAEDNVTCLLLRAG